jgi:hypothetical protein
MLTKHDTAPQTQTAHSLDYTAGMGQLTSNMFLSDDCTALFAFWRKLGSDPLTDPHVDMLAPRPSRRACRASFANAPVTASPAEVE